MTHRQIRAAKAAKLKESGKLFVQYGIEPYKPVGEMDFGEKCRYINLRRALALKGIQTYRIAPMPRQITLEIRRADGTIGELCFNYLDMGNGVEEFVSRDVSICITDRAGSGFVGGIKIETRDGLSFTYKNELDHGCLFGIGLAISEFNYQTEYLAKSKKKTH